MCRKIPELLASNPIFLHGNIISHGVNGMTSLLERYEWETLDHHPYYPVISPCDFDLFPKLNEYMMGVRHND